MKILFIGDYSNLHACLAAELRKRGHHVTVVSDRCGYMDTHSDIFLEREPGLAGGFKYLVRLFSLLHSFKGYDVVQLINSNFLNLKPEKIKYFFDKIKGENGGIFLTLAGDDYYFVKACADAEMFRFSEFKTGNALNEYCKERPDHMPGWISDRNRRWSEYLYREIDGAMSILPEYDMAARDVLSERLAFTNLPIDLSTLPYSPLQINKEVRIFIGMRGGMETQKGTGILLDIAKDIQKEMPDKVAVERVSNVSLKEYLNRMKNSHIVLDQLYSYSPATNALQAMALGKVAGSGAQPEYYEYIGNPSEHPVFELSPLDKDIKDRLRSLVIDPSPLFDMSRQGRDLVEKHNDVRIVADRFIDHWEKCLNK